MAQWVNRLRNKIFVNPHYIPLSTVVLNSRDQGVLHSQKPSTTFEIFEF